MRSSSIFIFAALLCAALLASSEARDVKGRWKPIKDSSNPHVVQIATFAVKTYNNIVNNLHELVFVKVVKGQRQEVDAGTNYKIDIEVKPGKRINNGVNATLLYQAVVFDEPSKKTRKLKSFEKIKA